MRWEWGGGGGGGGWWVRGRWGGGLGGGGWFTDADVRGWGGRAGGGFRVVPLVGGGGGSKWVASPESRHAWGLGWCVGKEEETREKGRKRLKKGRTEKEGREKEELGGGKGCSDGKRGRG